MKRTALSIIIFLSLLLMGCDDNKGIIIPDYRDKWMGDYKCQYGCVHSYPEGMDTANFVYTEVKLLRVKKRDGSVSGVIFSENPDFNMGVDSSGVLHGRYTGRFANDSLSFYWIDSGHPGFWFRRYKCAKIWPSHRRR